MVTEIDLLRKEIPRLELKFGACNPFVELLKAQLAYLQNQTMHRPEEASYLGFENIKSSEIQKRNDTSNKQL